MKATRILFPSLLLSLFAFPSESNAQRIADLFWLEYGFGYLSHTADQYTLYNGERVPGRQLHVDAWGGFASVGFYMPLLEVSRSSTIGLNADAALWLGSAVYDPDFPELISHLDQSDGAFQFALPILAMYKSGSDATLDPRSPAGFGAGVGIRPTLNLGFGTNYVAPIIAAELSYALEITLIKLRVGYTPFVIHPAPEVDLRTLDVGIYFVMGQ